MEAGNIVSVSWPDHLTFGEGDGRLATPDAVRRRLERWREELGARIVHWRVLRTRLPGRFYAARGRRHPTQTHSRDVDWDEFDVVPRLAHAAGLQAYLYAPLFDDGWPLAPKRVREVSYHNAMHGQHVAWQTDFSRRHPEYAVVSRDGRQRQWGVLCLVYPEVRAHFRERFLGLLADREFDGLFVCLRSQSRPADFADQFGFNEPVRRDFLARYGRDICAQDFDLQAWRDLLGEYLTTFLVELREAIGTPKRPEGEALGRAGRRLAVGAARGDVLGPPLGNASLQWREWVARGLVDELVINQNSSQCPSMWHHLWPMHRGYGYLQNYLEGHEPAEAGGSPFRDSRVSERSGVPRPRPAPGPTPGPPRAPWPRAVGRANPGPTGSEQRETGSFGQGLWGGRWVGPGLPPLRPHLATTYAPALAGSTTRLYVARQWDERDEAEEAALLAQRPVTGLVFSSFRHDNPGPVARADWRA